MKDKTKEFICTLIVASTMVLAICFIIIALFGCAGSIERTKDALDRTMETPEAIMSGTCYTIGIMCWGKDNKFCDDASGICVAYYTGQFIAKETLELLQQYERLLHRGEEGNSVEVTEPVEEFIFDDLYFNDRYTMGETK